MVRKYALFCTTTGPVYLHLSVTALGCLLEGVDWSWPALTHFLAMTEMAAWSLILCCKFEGQLQREEIIAFEAWLILVYMDWLTQPQISGACVLQHSVHNDIHQIRCNCKKDNHC